MDQGARAAHHAGSKMEKPKATIGPFRATKLWNTIVSDFRSGIPLKRHRWRVRYYDNCFTSTEAADWLLDYLCNSENFGPWVTRSQVVLLLDKFVQSKIIEEVKASKAPSTEKAAFEDNGHLYKFLPVSPMKKLRSALASRSSIQSLSPSPKPHKTTTSHRRQGASLPAPRTLSMRDPHPSSDPDPHPSTKGDGVTMEGCSSGAGTGGGTHVARPLAMRDSNIDARPRPTGTGPGHVTKELPRCTLISRPLTVAQIEEVWKSATLVRLQRLLWLSTLDGLLDDSIIVPSDIIHNCTHLNKNGVVQLLNKEDDLPHWVISAMRCLANWPNKIDSELPSYLGFERDVFKTISNYFQNLPEPLITYSRYDLVVEAFVSMECRDRGIVPGQEDGDVCLDNQRGLTSFQSVESLVLNMTTGGQRSNIANMEGRDLPARTRKNIRRSTSFGEVDNVLKSEAAPPLPKKLGASSKRFGSVDAISAKGAQSYRNIYCGRAARSNPVRVSNKDDDYGFAAMPPVRSSAHWTSRPRLTAAEVSTMSDQSHYEKFEPLSANLPARKCSSMVNIQDVGHQEHSDRPKSGPGGLFAAKKFGSAAELFNKLVRKKSPSQRALSKQEDAPKENHTQSSHVTSSEQLISPGLAPPPSYPKYPTSWAEAVVAQKTDPYNQTVTPEVGSHPKRISPPYPAPLRATVSFSDISPFQGSTTSQAHSSMTPTGMPSGILGSMNYNSRSTSDLQTSTPLYQNLAQMAQARLQRQGSITSISSLYLNEDKSYCQEALRLCLLLLPSTQRRALHLLLRLMSKMEANPQLVLSSSVPTRQLLLRTFCRCILRCEAEVDLDESLALRIVGYLLDNHATLFAVPQELREDIKERLTYLKRSQIKYEVDTENVQPAGFCAQVSMEEYEQNKAVSSQRAIEDLLDSIIADRAMPHKDKRKKLKLFQKAYPEIYHRRLPTSASEAELFPAKPKIKQPMLNVKRSLSKLKPIR